MTFGAPSVNGRLAKENPWEKKNLEWKALGEKETESKNHEKCKMTTLKEALEKELTAAELQSLPNAFDVIGSIAIFTNFPETLRKKERLIAETLLHLHPYIKTVAKKTEQYSGKYRLQKLKIIAGIKTKETSHKESSLIFKLNVEKCYFSPRTATERMRIARLVQPRESVLVMFSGISVFPIIISRHSFAASIIAVEANPAAHKYALKNLELNKVRNITAFRGDVKKVLPSLHQKFDRIIMPLPKNAEDYLHLALKHLKPRGIIHFYDFSQEKEFPESSIEKIRKHCKKFRILHAVKCGQYAPYVFRVCIDFQPLKPRHT